MIFQSSLEQSLLAPTKNFQTDWKRCLLQIGKTDGLDFRVEIDENLSKT